MTCLTMADRRTLLAWWFSPLMLLLFTPAHTPGSAQQQQPPPSNDNCASATPVAFGVAIIANPMLATFDASLEKLCNQFGTIPGVWFTFRGTGERITVMQISDEAEVMLHQGTTCGASTLTCVSSLYIYRSDRRQCYILSVGQEQSRQKLCLYIDQGSFNCDGKRCLFQGQPHVHWSNRHDKLYLCHAGYTGS
jgi:hypothetical protein